MMLARSFAVLLTLALLARVADAGSVYILKSQAYQSTSIPPTRLFRYDAGGTTVTDLGELTLGGSSIDADGLALSSAGLFAFDLTSTGSRLIEIDLSGSAPTPTLIGSELGGRDIRGAAFDRSGTLWALDAASGDLLTIDTSTGGVTAVMATLSRSPGNVTDIAFRADGTLFATSAERVGSLLLTTIHTIDVSTGALTDIFTDTRTDDWRPPQLAGIAFLGSSPTLYAWDIENWDDLLSYGGSGYATRTQLVANIHPAYNGGRGDLAASIVPLPPAGLGGLGLLLALAAARRLRRRR